MKLQLLKSAVFGIACAITVFALLSMFPPTQLVEVRYPLEVEKVVHDTICPNEVIAKAVSISSPTKNLNRHKRRKATKKEELYIQRFSGVAQAEQAKFGIPASITLAQGILESDRGQSNLARQNNNHFGMKCFGRRCKKGHCTNHHDDHHKDFFRVYESAWESYRAHSQLITSGRYKHLVKCELDYKAWAHGLKKAGYATSKTYAPDLIELIEGLGLDSFDTSME